MKYMLEIMLGSNQIVKCVFHDNSTVYLTF